MKYQWVIGSISATSEMGKKILSHASLGIGYVILNLARSKGEDLKYAFRRPCTSPVPHHLMAAQGVQVTKIEELAKGF